MTRSPALLLPLALLAASCDGGAAAPGPDAAPSAQASAPPRGSAEAEDKAGGDDDVRPVYPITNDPPDPRATKLCDAIHALPAARRAACCEEGAAPQPAMARECGRTLSFALRSGAITLEAEAIDRCVAALEQAHAGCGWVGPSPPGMPDACLGILRGTLKAGQKCRSTLECEGALRCHGLASTELGTCGEAGKAGRLCGLGVESLVAFVRQVDADTAHPECAGYCAGRRCADVVATGGACRSHVACGANGLCVSGKCAAGPRPAVGQPCPAGVCAGDARCVKGQCFAPRAEGEACEADVECRGACNRGDAGPGACGKRCGRR